MARFINYSTSYSYANGTCVLLFCGNDYGTGCPHCPHGRVGDGSWIFLAGCRGSDLFLYAGHFCLLFTALNELGA